MCGNKKSKFIKQQEASGLLGSLEIRARLRKIPNLHISQNLHIVPLDRLQKTKRIQKFKETGDLQYIYQNEPDKACFKHDMVYGDFKDLTRRSAFDKILHDKAINITQNRKYGYQRGLVSLVYNFFDRKLLVEPLKKKLFQTKK